MIKVTGNTYQAKEILKQAGFKWDQQQKAFLGDNIAKTELDRISTPTYSRKNQNLVLGLKFEEVVNEN
jgi:hypothetical protein